MKTIYVFCFLVFYSCRGINPEQENNINFNSLNLRALINIEGKLAQRKLDKTSSILLYLNGDCHVCLDQLNNLKEIILANKLKNNEIVIIMSTHDLLFFREYVFPRLPCFSENAVIYIDENRAFGNKANFIEGKNYFVLYKDNKAVYSTTQFDDDLKLNLLKNFAH